MNDDGTSMPFPYVFAKGFQLGKVNEGDKYSPRTWLGVCSSPSLTEPSAWRQQMQSGG